MMKNNNNQPCCEKFKTMIGGQALIEGIMMRGPETDAVVVRGTEGLKVETFPRKIRPKGSILSWPFIRGAVNFFDSQVVGVKALMRSADLAPEDAAGQEEPSKFDLWLEKKLGSEKAMSVIMGFAAVLAVAFSIGLFFLLPTFIAGLFGRLHNSALLHNVIEGVIRIVIFMLYLILISRMKDMRRVFSYHGAEHKTIFCYEAGLPLTVENVRKQPRHHPRCGTSFLFVVIIVSILCSSIVFTYVEWSNMWIRFGLHLILLPVVVAISYEFNRLVGRYDNKFTRILSAPGLWMQNFTTFEPDDSMIEVGLASVKLVIPEEQGKDTW